MAAESAEGATAAQPSGSSLVLYAACVAVGLVAVALPRCISLLGSSSGGGGDRRRTTERHAEDRDAAYHEGRERLLQRASSAAAAAAAAGAPSRAIRRSASRGSLRRRNGRASVEGSGHGQAVAIEDDERYARELQDRLWNGSRGDGGNSSAAELEQSSVEADRVLRQQQDDALRESLRQDREREADEEMKKVIQASLETAAEETRAREERQLRDRIARARSIVQSNVNGEGSSAKAVTTIRVLFSDGSRVQHEFFKKSATVEDLRAAVLVHLYESSGAAPPFSLTTHFPKAEFPSDASKDSTTLIEAELSPRGTVLVREDEL
eukprot:g3448.t1